MRRRGPLGAAILFFVFAAAFSVIFWPEVSIAAKIAFFVAGIGCGANIVRAANRSSRTE